MDYYFVTGTSRGIGKSLCIELLKKPETTVVGVARAEGIQHGNYKHFQFDLAHVAEVSGFAEKFFNIDEVPDRVTLINNAGVLGEVASLGNLDNERLVSLFNTNLVAPAILMNSFIRIFENVGSEKIIINISSGAALKPYDGWGGYCTSKAAINMLSEVASLESSLKNKKFKIFSIAPGVVDTGMQEEVRKAGEKDFSNLQRFINLKQKNELSNPDEAAKKIIRFIDESHLYTEVVQDIRKLSN